jgi:hypothetical protein
LKELEFLLMNLEHYIISNWLLLRGRKRHGSICPTRKPKYWHLNSRQFTDFLFLAFIQEFQHLAEIKYSSRSERFGVSSSGIVWAIYFCDSDMRSVSRSTPVHSSIEQPEQCFSSSGTTCHGDSLRGSDTLARIDRMPKAKSKQDSGCWLKTTDFFNLDFPGTEFIVPNGNLIDLLDHHLWNLDLLAAWNASSLREGLEFRCNCPSHQRVLTWRAACWVCTVSNAFSPRIDHPSFWAIIDVYRQSTWY